MLVSCDKSLVCNVATTVSRACLPCAGDQLDAAFSTLRMLNRRLAALRAMAHEPASCCSAPGVSVNAQVGRLSSSCSFRQVERTLQQYRGIGGACVHVLSTLVVAADPAPSRPCCALLCCAALCRAGLSRIKQCTCDTSGSTATP